MVRIFILKFLILSMGVFAWAAEPTTVLGAKALVKPSISFRIVDADENNAAIVDLITDEKEIDIRDDTGFLSAYMVSTYLIKRQYKLNNYIFFKVHKTEKALLLKSLEDLSKFIAAKPNTIKTGCLVNKALSKIKSAEKIEGTELLKMILEIESSLTTDSKFSILAATRQVGKTKWDATIPWRKLALPAVADGRNLTYQK